MKNTNLLNGMLLLLLSVCSCHQKETTADASGAFEAETTIISAQGQGVLTSLEVSEGQRLKAGQIIGSIDSTELVLKKKQIQSQLAALSSKKADIQSQLSPMQKELDNSLVLQRRMNNLVQVGGVTEKDNDEINTKVEVLKRTIADKKKMLENANRGVANEMKALQFKIDEIDFGLKHYQIVNPIDGTVLNTFAEPHELVSVGKPLYTIADLSSLILKVYLTGEQLSHIRLNQKVKVLTDKGADEHKTTEGEVIWISDEAEFTPKNILTQAERANLVYPIKVRVKNDGSYKIGMYGEIKIQ